MVGQEHREIGAETETETDKNKGIYEHRQSIINIEKETQTENS